jgi:TPR repeat protein
MVHAERHILVAYRAWRAWSGLLLLFAAPLPSLAMEGSEPGRPVRSPVNAQTTANQPALAAINPLWQAGRFEEVASLARPIAQQGDRVAQYLMGELYYRGFGVPQSDTEAVRWWRLAADQGLARAQNEIGVALSDGWGVDAADPRLAVEYYRKAADQGLAAAQVNLGLMHLNGLGGLEKSEREAVFWFGKAAEQGLGWAQYYLGIANAEGRGVRRNPRLAAEWMRKAADQEYTEAQYQLGRYYLAGSGVTQSDTQAAYWFALAMQRGHDPSRNMLASVVPRLSRTRAPAGTRIRDSPDEDGSVIRVTRGREYVYVLERNRRWLKVYLPDGNTVGYMSTGAMRR